MNSTFFNRRKLMTSLAAVMSTVGAGTLMATSARPRAGTAGCASSTGTASRPTESR